MRIQSEWIVEFSSVPQPISTVLVSSVREGRFLPCEAVVTGARNGNSFDSRLTAELQLTTSEVLSKIKVFTTGKYIYIVD